MKLFRSLSFRLALLYVAFFTISGSALGGLYYWIEVARPLESVRSEIREESTRLLEIYRVQGQEALAIALESRAAALSPRMGYHALIDAQGRSVTANLPSWPAAFAPGWKRIEADISREGDEDEYEALVIDQRLSGGTRLLLGRDIEDIDELEESLKDTLVWLIPALLVFGIVGGALMSRVIGGRIDSISKAARGVIEGDLSKRIDLRGSDDDFDRLAATLNLMLDRLSESLEAVRRVSDSVAHELRTPVARLQAALVELQGHPTSTAAAEAAAEARRLGTVVDAVLRISRIEAARHVIQLRPVDLSILLKDVVEFYQPEAEARLQRLTTRIPSNLRVAGDGDLLFQAFANLLDNALKFTPEGGGIALTVTEAENCVVVEVSDDGPGIPAELLDRITERFFRAPSAALVPGLGLGLSLVAAVAAAHHSSLEFGGAEEGGFSVKWRLPSLTLLDADMP